MIGTKQLQVRGRINAAAVYIRLDTAEPQGLKILLMPHKGHTEHNFVVFHQLLYQLQPEAVEHVGVVGQDQNFAHFSAGSFSSWSVPVPPSTTPSCRRTLKMVPKKQRQSKRKLMF